MFSELPAFAAWRFVDAVDGFEVLYARPGLLRGHTSAVEDGRAYAVRYEITLDDRWRTREARVWSDTRDGPRETILRSDGEVVEAPAAYVRAIDLSVTRLDQTYSALGGRRYDYASEGGRFHAVLEYDEAGLIVEYPGIAVRRA